MAVSSFGIGLIGVGRHGSRYVQHLLQSVPGVHLAALCRKRTGEGLALSLPTQVPLYGDYRTLIADPAVQAIVVVTPPALCHDICLEAVKAGKPLLIEKPLAATAHEARAMVEAAEQAGVLLMTAQTMRFDPTILRLRNRLSEIGPLRYATLTSRIELHVTSPSISPESSSRGALLEVGIHLLDLVRFLTGEDIVEVRCEVDAQPPATAESFALAQLTTCSGLRCLMDVARVAAGRVGRTEWIGTRGQLTADWTQCRITSITNGEGSREEALAPEPTIPATLLAFSHAIATGTMPPITGRDGLAAVEIAEACYESAARGGARVTLAR